MTEAGPGAHPDEAVSSRGERYRTPVAPGPAPGLGPACAPGLSAGARAGLPIDPTVTDVPEPTVSDGGSGTLADDAATRADARRGGPVESAPPIGSIGEYDILHELGRGAMGVVYLARSRTLGRLAAVKVLLPEAASSSALRERFRREAEATGRLRHPAIVPVLGAGEDGGVPYIAMAYVPGDTLSRVMAREVLPLRTAVDIVRQVAEGLGHAHRQGVIHRDVKPSNIMLVRSEAGVVAQLTDFGIARLDARSQLTRAGAIVGTPLYMSPEQADGQEIDGRSDLFSLASVLYHLVALAPPFEGGKVTDILDAVKRCRPRRPSLVRPDVPRDLDAIAMRGLARDPARRFPDGESFARSCEAFLERYGRDLRARHRVRAAYRGAALAVLAILLALGAAGPLRSFLRRWQQRTVLRDLQALAAASPGGDATRERLREILARAQGVASTEAAAETGRATLRSARVALVGSLLARAREIGAAGPWLPGIPIARIEPLLRDLDEAGIIAGDDATLARAVATERRRLVRTVVEAALARGEGAFVAARADLLWAVLPDRAAELVTRAGGRAILEVRPGDGVTSWSVAAPGTGAAEEHTGASALELLPGTYEARFLREDGPATVVRLTVRAAERLCVEPRRVEAHPGEAARLLASARPGWTVVLAPGEHPGPLVIDVPAVSVVGPGPDLATVRGTGNAPAIRIAAPDVRLEGFRVEAAEDGVDAVGACRLALERMTVRAGETGIRLRDAPRARIAEVSIEARTGIDASGAEIAIRDAAVRASREGIVLRDAPASTIDGLTVRPPDAVEGGAARVLEGSAIHLESSPFARVARGTVEGAGAAGVFVRLSPDVCVRDLDVVRAQVAAVLGVRSPRLQVLGVRAADTVVSGLAVHECPASRLLGNVLLGAARAEDAGEQRGEGIRIVASAGTDVRGNVVLRYFHGLVGQRGADEPPAAGLGLVTGNVLCVVGVSSEWGGQPSAGVKLTVPPVRFEGNLIFGAHWAAGRDLDRVLRVGGDAVGLSATDVPWLGPGNALIDEGTALRLAPAFPFAPREGWRPEVAADVEAAVVAWERGREAAVAARGGE